MCREKYIHNDPSKNMSFSLFKRIADQLFQYVEYIDLRGFGESLILPDFHKFTDYALKFEPKLKLVTNFSIKNDKLIKYLAEKNFMIGVSFDGGTKKTFERIRKYSHFENIIHNIRLFQQHSNKDRDQGVLYLQVTLQVDNIDEIPLILKIAHKLGIKKIKLFSVMRTRKEIIKLLFYRKKSKNMLNQVNYFAKKYNLIVELCSSTHASLTFKPLVRQQCIHPWMYCTFDYQGMVGYCDNLLGLNGEKGYVILGDINKHSFHDIWNSTQAQEVRKAHNNWKNGFIKKFNECNWCYNRRYIDLENLFYPSYSRYIVSNLTKKILYKKII